MQFTVSEDVEIIVDGEKYLLEKGDKITVEARGALPSVRAAELRQDRENTRIDAGRPARQFKVAEDRDKEVLASIINELMQFMPIDGITVKDVVDLYNEKFDPRNKQAGKAFDPDFIQDLIKQTERQQLSLI